MLKNDLPASKTIDAMSNIEKEKNYEIKNNVTFQNKEKKCKTYVTHSFFYKLKYSIETLGNVTIN